MGREFVSQNEVSLKSLRDLIGNLSDTDFDFLVGKWTVTVCLCHLAFWDRMALARLKTLRGGERAAEKLASVSINPAALIDCINDGCELISRAVPGRVAAQMAVESAAEVDAYVAQLDDEVVRQIESCGMDWMFRRSLHRMHHLERMQLALSSPGKTQSAGLPG